ncbi:MAG TPA: tRNA lysidine(34) synthetase TilS [Chitinophagaceae bacterium]|nr:tRNA lysidine(34) synthetase TilS [Chitinophagaceae bacterium]
MNLALPFQDYIKKHQLFNKKDKLLLTVSGGVDSVVLCALCKNAGYDFAIAHCNFQLRGADSNRDENFVRQLAENLGVKFFSKTFDTENIAVQQKKGIEETAREIRYQWFHELLESNGFQYILTAHHADDNAETIAMNFFRGTGINGLRGMLAKNGKVVRPLLFARKEALLAEAKYNQLTYVSDYTNDDNRFTRNFFRNKVLPLIETVYPATSQNLIANAERLSEAAMLYKQSVEQHKKKLIEQKDKSFQIPVLKLKKSKPVETILFELLKTFNFTASQTAEVAALLDSATGKYVNSSTHRVLKNRNWLIISSLQHIQSATVVIDENDCNIDFDAGKLSFKISNDVPENFSASAFEVSMDAKEFKFPLLLRKWKTGDYFYPLGMKKKKKLSRFFIDNKLSKLQKENAWVLETNKRIVWVLGHRIDERFKLTPTTTAVIQFKFLPAK